MSASKRPAQASFPLEDIASMTEGTEPSMDESFNVTESMLSSRPQAHSPPLLVTVGLEDYFHVRAFSPLIRAGRWSRFEQRIEESTQKTLALLDAHQVRATFFVMGWVAEQFPELVREVAERGHEIANQGYAHKTIKEMASPEAFREDLLRAQAALERACGRRVIGYRVPHFLTPDTMWALDVLLEEGYQYDSSLRALGRTKAFESFQRFPFQIEKQGRSLTEMPVSSWSRFGLSLPLAGNVLRQLPPLLAHGMVEDWFRRYQQPWVTYFHVWELDVAQPLISASSWLTRLRHYRNLDQMQDILAHYFQRYPCMSIAEHLGLETPLLTPEERTQREELPSLAAAQEAEEVVTSETQTPVSIVIPCYNESQTLMYLKNTLETVRRELHRYDITFIFVDDGSGDDTAEKLQHIFGERPGFQVVCHLYNRGVAAAIMTGIWSATTEIVASMDCDCTYDPVELGKMIPLLSEDVSMVTASPYHEDGHVVNVPSWRLVLSRGASWLYQQVLQRDLATYTSCFRVYRRRDMVELPLQEDGFLGVAEMLGLLALDGKKIVEFPSTLESRMFGASKMKTLHTIGGHLKLLARLARKR